MTPQTSDFFMYYFVFTGIHLAHLAIGAVLLVCLAIAVRRPVLSPGRVMFVEGGGVYWHLVDMLWLVLFPMLYLVR
jgi:nitric oxide reductase NorE protein